MHAQYGFFVYCKHYKGDHGLFIPSMLRPTPPNPAESKTPPMQYAQNEERDEILNE